MQKVETETTEIYSETRSARLLPLRKWLFLRTNGSQNGSQLNSRPVKIDRIPESTSEYQEKLEGLLSRRIDFFPLCVEIFSRATENAFLCLESLASFKILRACS